MNPEINYEIMRSRIGELHTVAAEERLARQARRSPHAERRHRSLFARLRAA
ncbi:MULTISPECIES: hypothetical protein [unclassified Nonomuraea]|uniref:hypothetical protein n=1 Tax=Nonomuraea sp. NPDC003804 TaxID=3154547 RepID=UPI0033B6C802